MPRPLWLDKSEVLRRENGKTFSRTKSTFLLLFSLSLHVFPSYFAHHPHDFHVQFCNVGAFPRLSPCYFHCAGTLYSICFGNSLAQVLLNNKVDLHDVHKGKWQRATEGFLFPYYCYSMQIAAKFLRGI